MFDWVPIRDYTPYFNYMVLAMVFVAAAQCFTNQIFRKETISINAIWGLVFSTFLILYMGLRPISNRFGDTVNYATDFETLRNVNTYIRFNSEWAFGYLMLWFNKLGDIHSFFLTCALIYVGSLWWAMKRLFGSYYWIPLLVVFSMFTFWNFGVNGVRNGMGASVFILALSFANHIPTMILLAFLATGFHTSVWIMIGAAIMGWLYKNSKTYLCIWILCVIISWFWGATIQEYLGGLPMFASDGRFSDYLVVTEEEQEMQGYVYEMKFRWDFLAYSAMGVAVGYYFIFKRKFLDEYYHWIFNAFLITNAFWVLIIRAQYTNRFAQISWFIMPIVLIYPFMKKRFWRAHERMLGYAIVLFYAFAFYYNIIR